MHLLAWVGCGAFLWLMTKVLQQLMRERDRQVSQKWLEDLMTEEASRGLEEGAPRRGREPILEPSPSATDAYKRPWVH